MNSRAQIRMLADGRRLHLHDGPIDLIVEAFGKTGEIQNAYRAATSRFVTVLDELCEELPLLRQPVQGPGAEVRAPIARRMMKAVKPYAERTFITPMAAVAGAVAEEILESMIANAELTKAYVNDGGDIALHIGSGEEFSIGMVERPDRASLFGKMRIQESDPVRGIATSGWRGRSFSLGIADAVTILARTAACADSAATIVANAVDLPGSAKVHRIAAREIAPDSDLGDIPVTQAVEELTPEEVQQALHAGEDWADHLIDEDLIFAAALHLQGETRIVGTHAEMAPNNLSGDPRRLVHA